MLVRTSDRVIHIIDDDAMMRRPRYWTQCSLNLVVDTELKVDYHRSEKRGVLVGAVEVHNADEKPTCMICIAEQLEADRFEYG
jgi:hypothetical protein